MKINSVYIWTNCSENIFLLQKYPWFHRIVSFNKFCFKFRFDFADAMRHMYTGKKYRKGKDN